MMAFDFLLSKEDENSLIFVTQKAFSFLKLNITKETVKELLLSHPEYPSLLSFSDILKQLQISYEAIKINEEQLLGLEGSFFAYLPKSGLVFVSSITNRTVSYVSGSKGWITESSSEFRKKWSGIVFIINTNKVIAEEGYGMKKLSSTLKSFRAPSIFIILFLLIALFGYKVGFSTLLPLLFLKIAGFFICCILTYFEINQTKASSKFCKIGTKVNCQSVLTSSASKLLGVVSMTDIGLIYYTSGLAFILFYASGSTSVSFLNLLTFIAILTLPYTFFSVYYQSFVIRKWCTLCLSIIFILWLEAVSLVFFTVKFNPGSIQARDFMAFAFLTFSVIIIWSYLKEFLVEREEWKVGKYQFFRLIRKEEVFNVLQGKSQKVNPDFLANHISIGQPDARNNLLVIINPMCMPCAKKYKEIIDLIRRNTKKFNANFLFHVGSLDVDNHDTKVSATLIELFYRLEEDDFINAVNEWFLHRDLGKINSKYQVSYSDQSLNTLEKQYEWLKSMKIKVAPMLFFNGRKVLKYYSTKELGLLV